MPRQVSGTRSGWRHNTVRFGQLSCGGVKGVDKGGVESEIVYQYPITGRIHQSHMRMWRFLAPGVGTEISEVRDNLWITSERAVRLNREDSYGAPSIIGRQQILSPGMKGHMCGLPAGSHCIEKPQCPCVRIDAEGRCAAGTGLVSGIEKSLSGIHNDEGGAGNRGDDTSQCQLTRYWIIVEHTNSTCVAAARIASHVGVRWCNCGLTSSSKSTVRGMKDGTS